MNCALIDVGSNTIRMNVYRIRNEKFRLLFSKKTTAGIVSYVKEGKLNKEGIDVLASTLDSFTKVLNQLGIDRCFVFATASLRNINNTQDVLKVIERKTGIRINVIDGREEAMLSFQGAALTFQDETGIYIDVGGGSSEVVAFDERNITSACSMPIGSLNLFNMHVKDILPTQPEITEITAHVHRELKRCVSAGADLLFAGGGSARAVEKLLIHLKMAERKGDVISLDTLLQLQEKLCHPGAAHLLLLCKPERIHTFVPGLLIMTEVMKHCGCREMKVSRYGVREGYLMKITRDLRM